MANEEPKALAVKYVLVSDTDRWTLQRKVNEYIEKWYIPLWGISVAPDSVAVYSQALIDPLVLERQQLTVRNITKWAITTTSTVTIPDTVNVSWCECNCW